MSDSSPQTSAVDRAQRELEAGRPWRARDLLTSHVEAERDPEALALLAQVLHDMGDLPRAGAVWFAAGARGPEVDAAVAAWREQTGDDFAAMWRSLPASARREPRARRVEALRERARAGQATEGAASSAPPDGTAADGLGEDDDGGWDLASLTAWGLAALFVVLAVIGFVTVLGWVVPG